MRCDQIDILLDAYIDGELPTDEAAILLSHLEDCSTCRAELGGRRALRRAFGEGGPVGTAPVGLQERILAAAAAAATPGPDKEGDTARPTAGSTDSRWWRRAAWPLAVAAAASLALVVLGPDLLSRRQGEDQPPPFSTPARVIVPRYGEQAGRETPVRFGGIDLDGPNQGRSS